MELQDRGLYKAATDLYSRHIGTAVLAPRKGRIAEGLLLCVSKVLHRDANDGEFGHFVAAYSREEVRLA